MTFKIERFAGLLGFIGIALTSGCSTPANVKMLSNQARQEARMLGSVHEQTIQAFSDFTQVVEDKGRPLVAFAQDRHQRLGQAGYLLLAEKVNAAEARLLAKFDSEVAELVGSQFEQALQTNFWDAIGKKKIPLEAEKKKFAQEYAGAPNDTDALKRFTDKSQQLLDVDKRALAMEVELRKKMAQRLRQARCDYVLRIQSAFSPLRDEYLGKASGVSLTNLLVLPDFRNSAVSTNLSLKRTRAELATFRTQVANAYASHQESLEGIRDYLERPGISQLLISGMFQAVGDLLKSKLPELGSWGDSILEAAQPVLSKAEDALNSKIAEGEKLLTDSANKVADDLGKAVNEVTDQVTAPGK